MAELTIRRRSGTTQCFTEDLGNGVELDMVLIPGGTFHMGSPEDEPGYEDYDGPQHEVTVPTFFMGRYPVTQAQWRAVANSPQVKQKLELEPSHFKGNDLPVELVIWDEAVEFCARLSRDTGKQYGLPSEAQWEYACRAGTTTPFHFGNQITTELANYNGSSYNNGPSGQSAEKTTPVGSFPANAWGLHEMHGNVWEWCADNWHENYKGAPTDGSAWMKKNDEQSCVQRGGSWDNDPRYCRSASRLIYNRDDRSFNLGFRVMCEAPRTP